MRSKNVVIIPVRGNSKRLANKNAKLLGGIPLLVHSINYAKKNPEICHQIIVSTEDETLKNIALKEGVTVIDRPISLADDNTPTKEVLQHVIENCKIEYDNVILLQATNPFREVNLLKNAFQKYTKGNYDSLMTVTENKHKFGKIIQGQFTPFNYHYGQRSQDLESLFYENGLLYITKASLINKGLIIGDKNCPYIVNHPSAKIDIDDEEDFEMAKIYYQRFNKEIE